MYVNLTYNNYMKKYVKFENKKILIVNKKYKLSRFYNPKDILPCVKESFENMQKDAYKEKVLLLIVSGFRSYAYQTMLYNRYKKFDKDADRYSAIPSHSEHQTGLAIDLINTDSINIAKFKKEFDWLDKNAHKYGFILRYPKNKEEITGYKYEPWHYRYVGESLAKVLYNNGNWITLEEYFNL